MSIWGCEDLGLRLEPHIVLAASCIVALRRALSCIHAAVITRGSTVARRMCLLPGFLSDGRCNQAQIFDLPYCTAYLGIDVPFVRSWNWFNVLCTSVFGYRPLDPRVQEVMDCLTTAAFRGE